jgi:hypothetical protein
VVSPERGEYELLERGGYVCVQLYLDERDSDSATATERAAQVLESSIATLGGEIDAMTPGLISASLPVKVGFPSIEAAMAEAMSMLGEAQWQFANVYDPGTGEPLGWWEA